MIVLSRVDNTEIRWRWHPISPRAIQYRIGRVCYVCFAFLSDSCLVCGKVVQHFDKWTDAGEWSGWNYLQAMRNACFHVEKYACAAQKAIKIWFWVRQRLYECANDRITAHFQLSIVYRVIYIRFPHFPGPHPPLTPSPSLSPSVPIVTI